MISARLTIQGFLVVLSAISAFAVDSDQCKKWGFTGEAACADCETLNNVLKDKELYDQCQQCCQAVEEEKFMAASLNHCPESLRAYPELEKFLAKHADDYPKLTVIEKLHYAPHLKLFRSDGTSEIVRIDSWNVKTLVEFLGDHLESGDK